MTKELQNLLTDLEKFIYQIEKDKFTLDVHQVHLILDHIANQGVKIERLNNIINGYANMKKELLDYIYHNEYSRFGHIDGGEAEEMREIISKTDKLKALKEDDDDGQ